MIQKSNFYLFGSFEDWICQALDIYMNSKEPVNQEESEYAALQIPEGRSGFVVQKQEGKGYPLYPLLSKEQVVKWNRQEP